MMTHQAFIKKSGTPTMGGIFIFGMFLTGVFVMNYWTPAVIWIVIAGLLFATIGFVDDWVKFKHQKNKGISATTKFLAQCAIAITLTVGFNYFIKPIQWFEYVLYVFLFVGSSNATNLTDGLDGLLSSSMVISLIGVGVVSFLSLHHDILGLSVVLLITLLTFLLFNWKPAMVFMRDTGSLMLGGLLAAICLALGQWPLLVGFGGIFVIEVLSVIIQVIWFKFKKKRVFLMSPLHHHFELIGLKKFKLLRYFVAFTQF